MLGAQMSDITKLYWARNDGNIYILFLQRPSFDLRVAPWYLFFFKLILDMLDS